MGRYYRYDNCSSNGGYIDTQGTTPPSGPYQPGLFGTKTWDADGKLSPTSSIGYWLETSSTSGIATVQSITTVWTFSYPIVIDNCPTGGYASSGSWVWSECNTLNGWTYKLSADGKTLTMTYAVPTKVTTSTSSAGTGTYVPGYFINYHVLDCTMVGNTTIGSSTTMRYTTADQNPGTFTKTTGPNPIV